MRAGYADKIQSGGDSRDWRHALESGPGELERRYFAREWARTRQQRNLQGYALGQGAGICTGQCGFNLRDGRGDVGDVARYGAGHD